MWDLQRISPDSDFGVGDGQGNCREGSRFRFSQCLTRPGWRNGVNHFISMKFRFYHGGDIKFWDPAKGIPSREQDPGLYSVFPEKE